MTRDEMVKRLDQLHIEAVKLSKDGASKEDLTKADEYLIEALGLQKDIGEAEEREKKLKNVGAFLGEGVGRKSMPDPAEARGVENKDVSGGWHFGEFLQAVVVAEKTRMRQVDPRLKWIGDASFKAVTGLSEAVPTEAGWLVQPEFAAGIQKRTYDTGVLAAKCQRNTVSGNSLTLYAEDETSRATGSRHGGVRVYWQDEADALTSSKPKLRKMTLNLHKMVAAYYATDELLADARGLGEWVASAIGEEFGFELDRCILSGTGAGQPLGILNGAALVSVAAEAGQAATTLVAENVINMWSRSYAPSRVKANWFINQDIEPQLHTMTINVGTGGIPVYMPAGGLSGQPYGTLWGRPVIPIEQASTLGTVGDIMLLDLNEYQLIEKGGVVASTSMHVRFLQDEGVWKFVQRFDGQPLWSSTLTPYTGATNTRSPFVAVASRT